MTSYEKLSGQRRNAAGYSRLWIADDHVLLVTTSGYSEEYRRFFFSDIQALMIRKTAHFSKLNWAFGTIAVLFAAGGFATGDFGGSLTSWIFAAIALATVSINTALGPTCSVQIQTAVAAHPLEPLQRLRAARKIIARLVPLITAAQGEVTQEQLATITAQPSITPAPPVMSPS